jgi:hypothetical protein
MWGMPFSPAAELVITIEPPPTATRCGIAGWIEKKTPLRLTSSMVRHICSVISAAGA